MKNLTKKQLLHLALETNELQVRQAVAGTLPAFQQNLGKNMRLY
jgi:hypothetical protein